MRTTLKLFFLICLSTMLLLSAMLLFGCASPSATQSTPATENVRHPKGNPESFWDKFYWSDLTPAEQELWGRLGWDKDSWDGKALSPPTENMAWDELTPEERSAARQLGYNRFYWDTN